MNNISIIGLGNISYELCSFLNQEGFDVIGTTDNIDRKKKLTNIGVKVYRRNQIKECIAKADRLIITVPPDNLGCEIVRNYSKEIKDSNIKWIGYLSSTSVYGNYDGDEVDESSEIKPIQPVAVNRAKAEKDVQVLGQQLTIAVEIFRVSGIYGNNYNIIKQILFKGIKPIFKEGHYFNRIHEKDIARVLCLACSGNLNSGIINLSDNLPAPQLDIIEYAYSIMNKKMPKSSNYKDIYKDMPSNIRRFWENNRRVNNLLLKKKYGSLLFPTYKEGLSYIYEDYKCKPSNKD